MTELSQIITDAYRESNLIPVGTSPTANEQTEALARLNNLIRQWFGQELGELLFDWQVPPVYTAPYLEMNPRDPYDNAVAVPTTYQPPVNVNIVAQITAPTTVFLAQYPNDGARMTIADAGSTNPNLTLNANGRLIEGAASLLVNLSTTPSAAWFYRADLATWVRYTELAVDDESPLPLEFDDLLITGLAIRLSPRYGVEPRSGTVATFDSMLRKLKTRYKQLTPVSPSQRIQEIQSVGYDGNFWGSNGAFLSGQ